MTPKMGEKNMYIYPVLLFIDFRMNIYSIDFHWSAASYKMKLVFLNVYRAGNFMVVAIISTIKATIVLQ